MYSKTGGVHVPSARGMVKILPDVASIAVRVKVQVSDPKAAPKALERALGGLERIVAPAVVHTIGYRSSSEAQSSKGLFGGSSRTTAEATCRVELALAEDDGYVARASAVEALRERLERAEIEGAAVVAGESRFVVADPEVHRAEATRVLHARVRESAEACGMQIDRLEVDTTLHVEVAGPCEAFVSVAGSARFRP